MRDQFGFFMAKYYTFMTFSIYIVISGDTVSYFLGMIKFFYKLCTETQTRMGLRRFTFSTLGPVRGQYGAFIAKYSYFYGCFLF